MSNLAGPDSNGANNSDSETTQVVAVADVKVNSVSTTSPLEVLIGVPSSASIDVSVQNDGPSSPIDTVLSGTAASSSGASVTPATTSAAVNALTSTARTISQTFTLTCAAPGTKTMTFDYSLALKNAADTDPDLTNNTGHASFTIDCVVPIVINVRPKGFPNSINLNTDATLAALTTRAGEYGLPLAFNAATIQDHHRALGIARQPVQRRDRDRVHRRFTRSCTWKTRTSSTSEREMVTSMTSCTSSRRRAV